MPKKITYRCAACGQTVERVGEDMSMPECCQTPMVKDDDLDFCEKPSDPEHARMNDNDASYDNGRREKIQTYCF